MGRRPGYHHSEETKARIAESVKAAATGAPATVRKAAPQVAKRVEGREVAPQGRQQDSMPAPVTAAPKDALDALAQGPVSDVLMMVLWVNRHNEPELTMQITERDLTEFNACTQYLGVTPEVRIVRPQGMPGHDAIPATRTRSAIPAAEPTPPKPFVTVCLVEKNTENALRPIESSEQGWQAAQDAKAFQRARDRAMSLAAELQQASATGNFSSSVLQDAAEALVALAR